MIDLRHIRTFCTVTDTNNFTLAAARLGCSQATVTTHIQALESELGVRLLERSRFAKTLILTDVGREALTFSRELLQLAETAPSAIRKSATRQRKR